MSSSAIPSDLLSSLQSLQLTGPIGFLIKNLSTKATTNSPSSDKSQQNTTQENSLNESIRVFCGQMKQNSYWELYLQNIFIFGDESRTQQTLQVGSRPMLKLNTNPLSQRKYISKPLEAHLRESLVNQRRIWLRKHIENALHDEQLMFHVVRRVHIEYEPDLQKMGALIRLGDYYLRDNEWMESAKAYAECAEILRDVSGDADMIRQLDGLNRLVFFGLGHALFALGDYIEAAYAFMWGFEYFPTFAALPFVPQSLYNDNVEGTSKVFDQHLDSLREMWSGLDESDSKVDQEKRTALQFLLSFQYHFTNRRSEALDLLEEIQESVPAATLIIEQIKEKLSLARKDSRARNSPTATSVQSLSLNDLKMWARSMIDPDSGVEIKNRSYRFKTYESCFIGQDLVTWICERGSISRSEAVDLGQSLLDRYFMRHVAGDHDFKDQFLFYRFYTDILEICFSPIVREGDIFSKLSGNKFQKYWGVVFVNGIVLFDNKKSGIPKEIVSFGAKRMMITAESIDSKVFAIHRDGFVLGFFKATSPDQLQEWLDAINKDLSDARERLRKETGLSVE